MKKQNLLKIVTVSVAVFGMGLSAFATDPEKKELFPRSKRSIIEPLQFVGGITEGMFGAIGTLVLAGESTTLVNAIHDKLLLESAEYKSSLRCS